MDISICLGDFEGVKQALTQEITNDAPKEPHTSRHLNDGRPSPLTRLIPVTKWPEYHPWPTIPALRWMIFNGSRNGFDGVTKRVGRRILIDEQAFFRWVEDRDREENPKDG